MNEIDLLKGFRDDMPEPSTDALVRARAAIAAAQAESAPRRKRARGASRAGWFRPMYAATLAAVAAVSAVAGALLSQTSVPGSGRVQTPAAAATTAVRALVADAMRSDAGNVVLTQSRIALNDGTVYTGVTWDYPWIGTPGNSVRQAGMKWESGVPTSAWSLSFKVPPASKLKVGSNSECQLTPRGISIDYTYRTWQAVPPPCVTLPPGLDLLVPSLRIVGYPFVDDQKTIELRSVSKDETFTLWLNSVSYLPLQSQTTLTGSWTEREQYTYLSATSVNLDKLKVKAPSSFTQIQVQHAAS